MLKAVSFPVESLRSATGYFLCPLPGAGTMAEGMVFP